MAPVQPRTQDSRHRKPPVRLPGPPRGPGPSISSARSQRSPRRSERGSQIRCFTTYMPWAALMRCTSASGLQSSHIYSSVHWWVDIAGAVAMRSGGPFGQIGTGNGERAAWSADVSLLDLKSETCVFLVPLQRSADNLSVLRPLPNPQHYPRHPGDGSGHCRSCVGFKGIACVGVIILERKARWQAGLLNSVWVIAPKFILSGAHAQKQGHCQC